MKKVSTVLAAMGLSVLVLCPSVLGVAMSESQVSDAMTSGYMAIKAKNFESAKVIFASIVKDGAKSAKVPEAMKTLGNLQLETDPATASNTYSLLAKLYPDTPEAASALYRLGMLGMRTKYLNDARDAFVAAAENKSISESNRGQALLQAGFVDLMKYYANEYWDRTDDGIPYVVKPGEADDKDQYLESARKQFETTEGLFAKSKYSAVAAVADAALGEIYLLSGKPALAEVAYRKVLEQYSGVPERLVTLAHYGLGQALYGQKNLDGALAEYDQALSQFTPGGLSGGLIGFQVAPKRALGDMHGCKVLTLYGLKRFDEALTAARKAKIEMEKDSELRDRAVNMDMWEGLILCQMDRKAEGLSVLRNVIAEHPDTPYADRARLVISQFEEGDE